MTGNVCEPQTRVACPTALGTAPVPSNAAKSERMSIVFLIRTLRARLNAGGPFFGTGRILALVEALTQREMPAIHHPRETPMNKREILPAMAAPARGALLWGALSLAALCVPVP